ncbi:zf-HC2 domain-containing protein [Candidatus Poribacteria bacterium]|nr:zf-HC2 domain-containing protein [Candidatus Poribacteria bacterium]
MKCPTPETLLKYQTNQLSPNQQHELKVHIEGCEKCRTEQSFLKLMELTFSDTGKLQIPAEGRECCDEEALSAYLDKTLTKSKRSEVEAHLAQCERCLSELAALYHLVESIQTEGVQPAPNWLWERAGVPRRPEPRLLVTLQDTQDPVTVYNEGTVSLGQAKLPSSISQWVYTLVIEGMVTPLKSVRAAMAILGGDAVPGALRSAQGVEKPVPLPLSPVLTAVRSTAPTLQWKAVSGAEKYRVVVADPDHQIAWEDSTETQTRVTLPPSVLQRGQVYFWQVEAIVDGQSRLSPPVGFWVLNLRTLREVEAAERNYTTSALVLASVYEAHGLYEEALTQLERFTDMNPTSPSAQAMFHNLRRQLGK